MNLVTKQSLHQKNNIKILMIKKYHIKNYQIS